MKKLFLFAAAIFAVCSVANAQFTTSSSQSSSGSSWTNAFADSPRHFGTFSVSYNPVTLKESYEGESNKINMTGFSLNWTNANKVCNNIPLYVDYGAGAQYTFGKTNDIKHKFLSIRIPVSVLFRLDIPNSKVAIAPYAGLDAVCYVLGKTGDANVFSDEGGEKFNRFNLDWHIGARIMLSRFFLAAAYEGPILGLYNKNGYKANFSQVNISLGFTW